jgi:hypothetical protein
MLLLGDSRQSKKENIKKPDFKKKSGLFAQHPVKGNPR